MRAAQLENNVVINFAEVAGFDDQFVDPQDSVIGSIFDPETEAFTAPAPTQEAPTLRHITKLAFRNRFTMGEKIAIDLASIDNPAAAASVRQQQAMIRVLLEDTRTSAYIDLDREDTRAGVQQLEAAGLLGTGRALEILDNPIQLNERPT
jgi:hypothetical protein